MVVGCSPYSAARRGRRASLYVGPLCFRDRGDGMTMDLFTPLVIFLLVICLALLIVLNRGESKK
jgi:hypothetical protein